MSARAGFAALPLQAIDDFQMPGMTVGDLAVFGIIIAAIAAIFVVSAAAAKKRGSGFARGERRGFSAFTLHRIAHDMGLDREQAKMLEFILRNDKVTDPAKSLDSPELMDQHFKRAYLLIERTSISEEELNSRLSVLFALRNIIETYTDTITITSTRHIPENTAAILGVGDLNHPTKVFSARGESLIMEHPVGSRGAPISIPKGGKVTLTFFIKSRGFSISSRAIGFMETMNRRIVKLAHSSKVKKLSNRRFRRRQTFISTSFYLVKIEASASRKENRLIVDKRQFAGSIMDISVGGCSIRTNAPIRAGHKIKIEFAQEDNVSVAALGEVLRTNRTGRNTVMHIKFLKIPRKSLNLINAMVYEYAYN